MALTTAEEALVRELIAQNPELLTLAASEAAIISKLGATKKNLAQLSPAGALSDTDLIFTRQGTLDRAATLSVLKTFALTGVPAASETVSGIVELATVAEAVAGADTSRAVTPAGVAAAAGGAQIQPIAASVAGNALTLTLNSTKLDFRSATLTDGTINKRTLSTPISLIVSNGSTLGTVNAVAARLVLIALDNSGTLELAVTNIAGGVNLDETTLISTTAEGAAGAADSASVVYSATARTNLPFRVVGFIDITEATAGTWATAPIKVQGYGGLSLNYIGNNVNINNLTGSRLLNTNYYNTTGKTIFVHVRLSSPSTGTACGIAVNGITTYGTMAYVSTSIPAHGVPVPHGAVYSVFPESGSATISTWVEWR